MRKKICAIYMIKNTDNGKVYIGSTRDYEKRKYSHLLSLAYGRHNSAELQKDYDNECNIEFSIIEKLSDDISQDDLLALENKYIKAQNSTISGYNTNTPLDRTSQCDIIAAGKLKYKIDVLAALKDAGFSTYRLQKDNILSQSTVQKLRDGLPISWANIEKLCGLLHCQPSDIIIYEE